MRKWLLVLCLLLFGVQADAIPLGGGPPSASSGVALQTFINGICANCWKEAPNTVLPFLPRNGAVSLGNAGNNCRPGENFNLATGPGVTVPAKFEVMTVSGGGQTGPVATYRLLSGGNYSTAPSGTLSMGTTSGSCSGVTVSVIQASTATNMLPIGMLLDGGVRCQVGDILTMQGGTGTAIQIKVERVNPADGQVQTFSYANLGNYSVIPSSGTGQITFTGGHCSTEPRVALTPYLTYPLTTTSNFTLAQPSYFDAEGPSGIVEDWTGMAFDPSNLDFYITGGGHDGYAGNELYVFHAKTLAWERLNNPSLVNSADQPQPSHWLIPITSADGTSTVYTFTFPNPYAGIGINHYTGLNQFGWNRFITGNVIVAGSDISGATTTGTIASGDTSITVASNSSFPQSGQFYIDVQQPSSNNAGSANEVMLVTAGAGTNTWMVTRAQGNSSPINFAGTGNIVQCWFCGTRVTSSTNFNTGSIVLTFSSPPAAGANIATKQLVLEPSDGSIPATHNYSETTWCPPSVCAPGGEIIYCPVSAGNAGDTPAGFGSTAHVNCWAWNKAGGNWRNITLSPAGVGVQGEMVFAHNKMLMMGNGNAAGSTIWYNPLTDTYGGCYCGDNNIPDGAVTTTSVDDNAWTSAAAGIQTMAMNGGSGNPGPRTIVIPTSSPLATQPDYATGIAAYTVSGTSVSGTSAFGNFTSKMATLGQLIYLTGGRVTAGYYPITAVGDSTHLTVSGSPGCSPPCTRVSGQVGGLGKSFAWDSQLNRIVIQSSNGAAQIYRLDPTNPTAFQQLTPTNLGAAPPVTNFGGAQPYQGKFVYLPPPYDAYLSYAHSGHGVYLYHK